MSHINNLLNFYIENDNINLTNNISKDDLLLLLENIKKYNIIINKINIPNNFKFIDIIKGYNKN